MSDTRTHCTNPNGDHLRLCTDNFKTGDEIRADQFIALLIYEGTPHSRKLCRKCRIHLLGDILRDAVAVNHGDDWTITLTAAEKQLLKTYYGVVLR